MEIAVMVVVGVVLVAIGWVSNELYRRQYSGKANLQARDILSRAEEDAEKKKEDILLRAKEERFRLRESLEKEFRDRQNELEEMDQNLQSEEKSLKDREERLNVKELDLQSKDSEFRRKEEELGKRQNDLEEILRVQSEKLETITQLPIEEAKKMLLENVERDSKLEAARLSKSIIDEAKEGAVREAKNIVTKVIEKVASEHTAETTVSVVNLKSDEMKGRIIGRDGRNIKAFENLTGVKIIVDDTPEAVVLSAFDPVKREVARLSLEKLIKSGKINPQKVEDIIRKSEKEVDQMIWQAATEVLKELGLNGVHPEMVKTLGRLRFRTSYGQNVLNHSKEVAHLCGAMAAELGFDVKLARRAGLFHDIGKAVSQNSESTHTQLGVELAKKYKEHPVVVNAIASHHEDEIKDNPISILVSAADSISGSRPGARRETLENYVRRIESLEKLADSFPGVSKAFAISAGREIRVMVEPKKVSDEEAFVMSSEIAKKIQSEMEYPGHIKVTVIRETRSVRQV